jgi:hypothetical protein
MEIKSLSVGNIAFETIDYFQLRKISAHYTTIDIYFQTTKHASSQKKRKT